MELPNFILVPVLVLYDSTMNQKTASKIHTLDLKPRSGEGYQAGRTHSCHGPPLALNARRAITILWYNAHLQGIQEGRDYTVEIDELKPDSHKGYERVEEAVESLMRTILTVKLTNGKTRRVQFLGGNDLDDPDRPAGVLTYSFDRRLIEILRDSTIWGKIALPVLMAFTSKYAVSLYENVAQLQSPPCSRSISVSFAGEAACRDRINKFILQHGLRRRPPP
jgi:replication initiator protein